MNARSSLIPRNDSDLERDGRSRLPLLYLPGMDATGQLFYRQRPLLSSYFDVRCLSLPSSGVFLSWEDMLDLAIAHMPDRPVVVCGESFGGCWALALAACYPHRLAGLTLINPATSLARQTWLDSVSQGITWLPDWVYDASMSLSLNWLLNPARVSARDRERFLATIRVVDKQTSLHRFQLLRSFRVEELPLEKVRVPTLAIASASDRVLPSVAEVSRLAERLPEVAIEVLPDSGHACLLERDVNVCEIFKARGMLNAFLAKAAAVG